MWRVHHKYSEGLCGDSSGEGLRGGTKGPYIVPASLIDLVGSTYNHGALPLVWKSASRIAERESGDFSYQTGLVECVAGWHVQWSYCYS